MKRLADMTVFPMVPGITWGNSYDNADFQNASNKLAASISKAPTIVVDNVAEYYAKLMLENGPQKFNDNDFPVMAPPFDQFFMEYRDPFSKRGPRFVGALFSVLDSSSNWMLPLLSEDDTKDAGWFLGCVPVGEYYDKMVFPGLIKGWVINKDGSIRQRVGGRYSAATGPTETGIDASTGALVPMLFGICFMNCQNVKVRTVFPSPGLSKKHNRKHGRPLIRYKMLDINPMKEVLETEGQASRTGLKMALHICRGHFKNLQHERFHSKGLHWWPAHIRGSAKQGAIVKDYNVKAPTDTPSAPPTAEPSPS